MPEREEALNELANVRSQMKLDLARAKASYDDELTQIADAYREDVATALAHAVREGATKLQIKEAWQTTDHGTIQRLLDEAGLNTASKRGRPKGSRNKEPREVAPKREVKFEPLPDDNTAAWSYNGDTLSTFDGEGGTVTFEVVRLADGTPLFSLVDGAFDSEISKRLDGATSGPTYDLALSYIRENGYES